MFIFFNDINVLFFLYDIIKIWDISMKLFITKNVMEIDLEFTQFFFIDYVIDTKLPNITCKQMTNELVH